MENIIIVSDGVPTLRRTLQYLREEDYVGDIKIFSTKKRKFLEKNLNFKNIELLNIFSLKTKLNNLY